MPAITLVLDAYSKAYPFITNRIKASIYDNASPLAVVASIIDITAGHPARTWHFAGLPRANYKFTLDEIDGAGNPVNNLAAFDVVPGIIDGLLSRGDEQIRVGTTVGFVAGNSVFVFDGTGGKPDYIGWEITPSELGGRNILTRGVDYSWDKTTGSFALLQSGDIFNLDTYYNIHFDPVSNPAGNSYPSIQDFQIELIVADITLDESYFGKKIIVEPAADYIEITLPDIGTVAEGRRMLVEVGVGSSAYSCVKFITFGADIINFLSGNLYAVPNESFNIYKFIRTTGIYEWRIDSEYGNFKTVGNLISTDSDEGDGFCRFPADGSAIDFEKFARLYNEHVLNLPVAQVCNFDDWVTGKNKYLFSLANSLDPGNVGLFHVPDRRGLFERNNNVGKAGDYQLSALKKHIHYVVNEDDNTSGSGVDASNYINFQFSQGGAGDFKYTLKGNATAPSMAKTSNGGSDLDDNETRPENYLINKFFLI